MKYSNYLLGGLVIALLGVIGYFLASVQSGRPEPLIPGLSFDETGTLIQNNPGLKSGIWYLSYEQPGEAGKLAELLFEPDSRCSFNNSDSLCNVEFFKVGWRVRIQGDVEAEGIVEVDRMTALSADAGDNEAQTQKVKLFYYNQKEDKRLSGGQIGCSREAALPLEREIPRTITPIQDTIRLLLKGELTPAERQAGFQTEFAPDKLELVGANLRDGRLALEFREVQRGFTGGGSCRVTILWTQIEKTARQFPGVREVGFQPEELFQP